MVYETFTGKQFEDKDSALNYEFNIFTAGSSISSIYDLRRFLDNNSEFIKEIMGEKVINLRRSKQEYVETRSEELDQETLDYLNTLPKITGVAIISHEGEVISLPAPNRHHNVICHMVDKLKHPIPIMGLQGFVCEDGTFLDRVCAKIVAINHNQLLERHHNDEELFSECVW